MKRSGRRSAAALVVATVTPFPVAAKCAPPDFLTGEQSAIFRAVVATKPAEWFGPDSVALLVQYCRHVATANAVQIEIDRAPLAPDSMPALAALLRIRESETRAILALARSMRLTAQSRLKAETAFNQHVRAADAGREKPWNFGRANPI